MKRLVEKELETELFITGHVGSNLEIDDEECYVTGQDVEDFQVFVTIGNHQLEITELIEQDAAMMKVVLELLDS